MKPVDREGLKKCLEELDEAIREQDEKERNGTATPEDYAYFDSLPEAYYGGEETHATFTKKKKGKKK